MTFTRVFDLPPAVAVNDDDILLANQDGSDMSMTAAILRSGLLKASNNLADVTNPVLARANLGISDDANWSFISTNTVMVPGVFYVCTNSGTPITLTLPTTCEAGKQIRAVAYGDGGFEIEQAAGQQMRLGFLTTTLGVSGLLSSTEQGDSVHLLCVAEDDEYLVIGSMGNLDLV